MRRGRGADAAPDAASVAAVVQRLAVLLQAGIAPTAAWRHLAVTGDPTAAAVCARLDAGETPASALTDRGEAWRQIAVAWQVATIVGAPLAVSLRGLAEALRDAHQARDDVRTALAEPQTTARLIAWLPLVALGLGAALGFDPFTALATPAGAVCLVAGGALMLLTHRWTRALVARAQPGDDIPGLDAEVIAIALSGGVSIPRATEVVTATSGIAPSAETETVLALSRSAGAPAVELLRADAAARRQAARTDGRLRAATLSGRLLLPLGVCTLPAFLLLGVGPMLLSVLTTTPLTL
ncbi:type II secretion system F family protein [Microbacterium oleivorans]|uniref:type II secretion system F family protein n=1 Tax=Microbacterium TaxID=33882 RepID=UPI00204183C1|nr:type II secretion system F family protein [Microbacterium oleivorans]MCM3697254.1 type II secretion system F family protein [Microbacterium oleivorans]